MPRTPQSAMKRREFMAGEEAWSHATTTSATSSGGASSVAGSGDVLVSDRDRRWGMLGHLGGLWRTVTDLGRRRATPRAPGPLDTLESIAPAAGVEGHGRVELPGPGVHTVAIRPDGTLELVRSDPRR
jgi:hypothetical protein